MAQDWRTAYFRQARSDYETLQLLEEAGASFCQRLHYLQMATEKLAKGFATAPGGPQQPKVHRGYVQFLQQIKRRTELQILCQCTPRQITVIAARSPGALALGGQPPCLSEDKALKVSCFIKPLIRVE